MIGDGAPQAARTGRHRAVGRHPGHRRGLQAGGPGGVRRRQRARRRHALQHAAAVRCRRHPDPASPQDLADLPRAHDLGPGRRLGLASRRQRGRAHRPAGVLGALQPAGPLRPDGRRRADPLGDVSRLVRGRPVRPSRPKSISASTPWSPAALWSTPPPGWTPISRRRSCRTPAARSARSPAAASRRSSHRMAN